MQGWVFLSAPLAQERGSSTSQKRRVGTEPSSTALCMVAELLAEEMRFDMRAVQTKSWVQGCILKEKAAG